MVSARSELLRVRTHAPARGNRKVRQVLEYFEELSNAMFMCSSSEHETIFMGQGICGGTTMSESFKYVPDEMKLEMPVAEDMQMGMATGMALGGYLPICIFPRWNFLLL